QGRQVVLRGGVLPDVDFEALRQDAHRRPQRQGGAEHDQHPAPTRDPVDHRQGIPEDAPELQGGLEPLGVTKPRSERTTTSRMSDAETPPIRLVGVSKRYSGTKALDDVSLDIVGGSVHALVGANGAGKSTLGKIVGGLVRADDGVMEVDGRAVKYAEPSDARADGIALIAQELALVPHLTVMQNVFLGVEPRSRGFGVRRKMKQQYAELLSRWDFKLTRAALAGSLRTADQQKVEILRAVACDARVIVMDEPTSSLTHVETQTLHDMIRVLQKNGKTIV